MKPKKIRQQYKGQYESGKWLKRHLLKNCPRLIGSKHIKPEEYEPKEDG